jgi:hypothetical protein
LYGPADPLAEIETENDFCPVQATPEIQLGKNIDGIISVETGHIQRKNSF